MTSALEDVDTVLRPGVRALGFHTLRWLGRAEAIRQLLAKRPPPPEADALLCVAIALAWADDEAPYTAHTLVDQAVEAAKRSEAMRHQSSFINGCLRSFCANAKPWLHKLKKIRKLSGTIRNGG